MKKNKLLLIGFIGLTSLCQAQVNPNNPPNDCPEAIPGCTTPSFEIFPDVAGTNNIVDFGTGTFSNPSTNPNTVPGNSGCLLTGETSSTFITIDVVSSGTLEWSIQGAGGGCFDWIMWPYSNSQTTCPQIFNNQLAPVSCNWNGNCQGFTGMALPGNLPAGADQLNFESALNVVAGQRFLLCLSNYSSTSQNVNFNFFGSALIACGVSAPDQKICEGTSANVTIATPGYSNPSFQWLVTTGVSNTTAGTNVTVTPTQTTTYQVRVTQPASTSQSALDDTATFTISVVAEPEPNAGLDDTVCFGSPFSLQGSITHANDSKSWSYFGINMSPPPTANFIPNFSTLTPTITVSKPGLYGFVLRENNVTCGLRRDTVKIFVKEMSSTSTFQNPTCYGVENGSIHLAGPEANNYSFDNGQTWQLTPDSADLGAGTYNVCIKDKNNCQICLPITLIYPEAVQMTLSNDTLICQNGTATLLARANGPTGFKYYWNHTSNVDSMQMVKPMSTCYFTVYAENQDGCLSLKDSILVELRLPISGFITQFDTVCPGYSTDLFALATGGIGAPFKFTWSSGEVMDGDTVQIEVTPDSTRVYNLTVTDACESTPLLLSSEVYVSPIPVPLFSADSIMKCEPAIFELTINSPASSYVESLWKVGKKQSVQNQDVIWSDELMSGSYNVQLILTNDLGCIDSVTYTKYLQVREQPEASFSFFPGNPTWFNTELSFKNTSQGIVSSEWFIEQGDPNHSLETNPTVSFPIGIEGEYQVKLLVKDDFGCVGSEEKIVKVLPELMIFAPNTFTPDYDAHNQEWRVHIKGIDIYSYELEVHNRWGELVWKTNDPESGWDGTYHSERAKAGNYTWRLRVKDYLNEDVHVFSGVINMMH